MMIEQLRQLIRRPRHVVRQSPERTTDQLPAQPGDAPAELGASEFALNRAPTNVRFRRGNRDCFAARERQRENNILF